MQQEFTPAQIEEKLIAFKKLTVLKDRLNFWDEELKMNYASFLENFNDLQVLHRFEICGVSTGSKIDESEWEEFNNWLIKNWNRDSKGQIGQFVFLDIEQMMSDFEEKLEECPNKETFVKLELKKVDDSFRFVKGHGAILNFDYWENTRYRADHETYVNYLEYRLSPDYSTISPGSYTIKMANGKALAEYRLYLSETLKSLATKSSQVKPKKQVEISIRKQLQILHYCGMLELMKEQSNVKKAEFLSLLLNKSEQNIRKEFSTTKGLVTSNLAPERREIKEELTIVTELFQKLGLPKIVKMIKADIEKLG